MPLFEKGDGLFGLQSGATHPLFLLGTALGGPISIDQAMRMQEQRQQMAAREQFFSQYGNQMNPMMRDALGMLPPEAQARFIAEAMMKQSMPPEPPTYGVSAQPIYRNGKWFERVYANDGSYKDREIEGIPANAYGKLPEGAGQMAEQKAAGKVRGERTAEAQLDAPAAIEKGLEAVKLIDDVLDDPGFDRNFGMMGAFPNFPGSEASDARAKLDQLQGKAFLEAFESLKGGGQITEIEGQRATDAIIRLQKAQSATAAKVALADFKKIVMTGVNRARKAAGQPPIKDVDLKSQQSNVDDLIKKYLK